MRSKQGIRTVDTEEVLHVAEQIVNEFGHDYVYIEPDDGICRYVYEGKPSCLVGHILVRLGARINVIRVPEDASLDAGGEGLGVIVLLEKLTPTWSTLGFTLTTQAVDVLAAIQNTQDTRRTWGQALNDGRRVAWELHA